MRSFINAMNKLPLLLKVILALPGLDIVWNIYRLARSISKKNTLGIILGILLVLVGWAVLWIIDIITILLSGKVLWID